MWVDTDRTVSDPERIGSVLIGSDRIGSDRVGHDRAGLDWIGSDTIGYDQIGSDNLRWANRIVATSRLKVSIGHLPQPRHACLATISLPPYAFVCHPVICLPNVAFLSAVLDDVRVPMLFVAARNDPICPANLAFNTEAFTKVTSQAPLLLAVTDEGGHSMVWPEGWRGEGSWLCDLLVEWVHAVSAMTSDLSIADLAR